MTANLYELYQKSKRNEKIEKKKIQEVESYSFNLALISANQCSDYHFLLDSIIHFNSLIFKAKRIYRKKIF